jgi:Arc/MetJ-type ribon-helix-helix transcriptional regulator
MTVTLTPEQMRWIEAAVAAGQFPSVEDAVRVAIDDLIAASEFGDLSWARPYIDEARARVARGEVVDGDEFLARLDEGIDALRSRSLDANKS